METSVVAITAASIGAIAEGLDLTPVLLERARENASIAGVNVPFQEGDVELLPYADESFDVVLSQFGHMFAPRPELAVSEMLRVLKPGGRIVFATWPPEHVPGQLFMLIGQLMPPPPPGAPAAAPPSLWGDPNIVRARLGHRVSSLQFGRSMMRIPALSARHVLLTAEASFGPLRRALADLDAKQSERAAWLRGEVMRLAGENLRGNVFHQHYLMSMATKRPL